MAGAERRRLRAVTPQRAVARGAVPRPRPRRRSARRRRAEVRMIALLIARNTFREATRDRVLVGAGRRRRRADRASTQLLEPARAGRGRSGSPSTSGCRRSRCSACSLVLLVGTSLVAKEIERRTIYNLLSRPIARHVYLIGKWAGLVGGAVGGARRRSASALCAAARAARAARARPGDRSRRSTSPGSSSTVVTAIAVMFSALSTPVLSALYTIGLLLRRAVELRPARVRGRSSRRALGALLERRRRTSCRTCRCSTCARWPPTAS